MVSFLEHESQSAVANEGPRDFSPEVSFGAKFLVLVARAVKERNVDPWPP